MVGIETIATALAAGAAAGLQETAKGAVAEVWNQLKAAVARWRPDVPLEPAGGPHGRNALAVRLAAGEPPTPELDALARRVLELIGETDPDALTGIGVRIHKVKGRNLELEDIQAERVGAAVTQAEFSGDIKIKGVRQRSGPPGKA